MNEAGWSASPTHHILIVEDSAIQAETLRRILVRAGYTVSVARNGVEGLVKALEITPTLVISDIIMPKMDGFEMCRRIKSEHELQGIPVILLTSLTDTGDVFRGLESGADNFITKPYEPEYLLSRLAAALSGGDDEHDETDRQGIEISFEGQSYVITADRRQILNTLLTTYETAIRKHEEQLRAREEMRRLNEELELKVRERTAALTKEIEERQRVEERLLRYAERMQAVDEVSLALSRSGEDYREAMAIVAQRAAEILGEWCVITLFSDDGQWLNPVAFYHPEPAASHRLRDLFAAIPYPAGRGVIGQVATTGASVVIDDLDELPQEEAQATFNPEILEGSGVRRLLVVPLRAHSETIGTLGLFRTMGSHYTHVDQSFIQDLADRAALTVYNAQLYEAAQRRLNNLQALHIIDQAVASGFNLNFSLEILLGQALQQLRVDAASVLLPDKLARTLRVVAIMGFRSDAAKHATLRIGDGHAGRVALERTIVTADLTEDREFRRSRSWGSEGFVAYCGVPLIVKGELRGVLELMHRTALRPTTEWLEFVNTLADQAAIAIDNVTLFTDLQQSNMGMRIAYDTTLEGWSKALDMRDRETEGHTQRVAELSLKLSREVGMSQDEQAQVWRGALLHDIGKMGIPDTILLKPDPLTAEEWTLIRRHPEYARELLSPIEYLRPALDIPYCHHEKWDGTGYPHGLKGERIPLAARLFAVVDVWDALLSDRPYRTAWSAEQVLEHIRTLSGTHFDPHAVELFFRVIAE